MKTKIYITDIITILIFHIAFITLAYFSAYNLMKYVIIVVIAIFLLPKYKLIFRKEYSKQNLALIIFILIVLVTSFINRGRLINRDVLLAGIIFSAIIFEAFLLFQYLEYKGRIQRTITIIFYLTLFYVILTDVLLLLKPGLFNIYKSNYLIGDKFFVAYAHLLLIALYWHKSINSQKKLRFSNKVIVCLMFILTFFISNNIESASGVVGCVFLFIFMIFNKKLSTICSRPLIVILFLVASCVLLLFFDTILKTPVMKFIIVDVLGKDITLTGRMWIYNSIFHILPNHFWTGYGHGSTFEICTKLLGAVNSQNGLLEILIQYGIPGVAAVLYLIYTAFKKVKLSNYTLPIVALIYTYMFLASVEITVNLQFFVFIGLAISCSKIQIGETDENREALCQS